jgi:putative ABC transport system ATP-binding protein
VLSFPERGTLVVVSDVAGVAATLAAVPDAVPAVPPGAFSGTLPLHAAHHPATATIATRRTQRSRPFTRLTRTASRMLVARGLTKEYQSGDHRLTVLRDVSFAVPQGTFLAIVGPSGSGKTTLLGLLAGLDTPTNGTVVLDGAELTRLSEDQRARLRGEKVGFVFQSFQLIPTLTALENVQVPLELRGERDCEPRARELLERVGLADRTSHYPNQLSGGEQQRVAIARAFSNRPRILFADEPTGNLDAGTGARIVELLERLNQEDGATVVLVTHDAELAARAGRVIRMGDGRVLGDTESEPAPSAEASAPLAALEQEL